MSHLDGPRGPIPYRRDAWGTPTVHARDHVEGAWARGYLHGTDRLLQVQLLHAVSHARLSALAGPRPFALRVDRAVRALGFGRGLEEAVAAMAPDLRDFLDAYCLGMRAGAEARGTPAVMRALGLDVVPWTPLEVLRTYRVLAWFGLTSTQQVAKSAIAELLARGADPELLAAFLGPAGAVDMDAIRRVDWHDDDALVAVPGLGGSNGFALSGTRTASGGAVVVAEFHMDLGRTPPVVYPIDLRYDDGTYLVGVTAPGVPYVLAGRTPRTAWAYTFGHADNLELNVEEVVGGEVRRGRRRLPLRLRSDPRTGDVLRDLPDGATVLGAGDGWHPAVRWRGMTEPLNDHEVLRGLELAPDVDALVALHRKARLLSTGACFGDADGRVAWMHTAVVGRDRSGWAPRRVKGKDLDAPERDRPVVVDPPEGFVASANEACPGWTVFAEPRYRKERLVHLLASGDRWTEADAERVTLEEHDGCAERLMAVWASLLPATAGARALAVWAAAQDRVTRDAGRRLRRRFHRLHHEASRHALAWFVGQASSARLLDDLGLLMVLQDGLDDLLALERPDALSRDALRRILDLAWWAAERAPDGPNGAPATVRFVDPLTGGREPSVLGWSSPPIDAPGGPTSLFQTRTIPFLGETITGGPVFRLVMDLGRSGARYAVAGGASERWCGPGKLAGIEAWAEGRYRDLGPRDDG